MKATAFLLFLHLCALVTASPRMRHGLAWPSRPDNDSFYLPPKDFESAAPGTILRQRRVDAAILGVYRAKISKPISFCTEQLRSTALPSRQLSQFSGRETLRPTVSSPFRRHMTAQPPNADLVLHTNSALCHPTLSHL